MEALISYPSLLTIAGIVLITLEVVVFGFATIFLVFIGLACFVTAMLIWMNVLPAEFLPAALSVAVFTLLFALTLWKPLRKMQSEQQDPREQTNTLDGHTFRLPADLDGSQAVSYRYSGIEWKVLPASSVSEPMTEGREVRVARAEVGKLYVEPV